MSYRQAGAILARRYRAMAHRHLDGGNVLQARKLRDAAEGLAPGAQASVDERLAAFDPPAPVPAGRCECGKPLGH